MQRLTQLMQRTPESLKQALVLVAAALMVLLPAAHLLRSVSSPAGAAVRVAQPAAVHASFGDVVPSSGARQVADWIAGTGDNQGANFALVDKPGATLYVFDRHANLLGSTPVLLGSARGDDSVPGIGTKPLSQVKPEERTTPAGRFVSEPGRNASGEDVVWIDYDAAVSMHRLRAVVASERRRQRIASPTVEDNRISYGCVNVPAAFYEQFVKPGFGKTRGVVYVLPDTKSLDQVFG